MKAYWTDTIIDRLVPAGTDVERGGPIEIYLAGDVAELAKRCLGQIEQWTWGPRTDDEIKLMADLRRIAKIPLKISRG